MDWTEQRIAALNVDQIKALQENAERLKNAALAALCLAELARRTPQKMKKVAVRKVTDAKPSGAFVRGFHFVCDKERGVTRNPDGTLWTGVWVVDKAHAERGAQIGAYVALQSSKAESSYLQGVISDWRLAQREKRYSEDTVAKTEMGVEFLLTPTPAAYEWQGDGAGEKGYYWVTPTKD